MSRSTKNYKFRSHEETVNRVVRPCVT